MIDKDATVHKLYAQQLDRVVREHGEMVALLKDMVEDGEDHDAMDDHVEQAACVLSRIQSKEDNQ